MINQILNPFTAIQKVVTQRRVEQIIITNLVNTIFATEGEEKCTPERVIDELGLQPTRAERKWIDQAIEACQVKQIAIDLLTPEKTRSLTTGRGVRELTREVAKEHSVHPFDVTAKRRIKNAIRSIEPPFSFCKAGVQRENPLREQRMLLHALSYAEVSSVYQIPSEQERLDPTLNYSANTHLALSESPSPLSFAENRDILEKFFKEYRIGSETEQKILSTLILHPKMWEPLQREICEQLTHWQNGRTVSPINPEEHPEIVIEPRCIAKKLFIYYGLTTSALCDSNTRPLGNGAIRALYVIGKSPWLGYQIEAMDLISGTLRGRSA